MRATRATTSAPLRALEPGERGVSLLQVAVQRAGLRKGSKAAVAVVSWTIAVQALERPLGEPGGGHLTAAVREYAAWWKISERGAWRDLQRFAAAFPEETSPARLAGVLAAALDRRAAERDVAAPLLALG